MLIRICCKCKKFLGFKRGGWGFTHTYCGRCFNELNSSLLHEQRRHNKRALWKERVTKQMESEINLSLGYGSANRD